MKAVSDLNIIFAKQRQHKALSSFLKVVMSDILALNLLTSDNEALVYLILNFYLYNIY